jgi:ElaB/YqjD/DUF883 family membrane-anchored ribosome-binding protein
METFEENRSPEAIERDIERTRSQMAGTLDDIQRKFSPGQMMDQALGYLEEKSGQVGSEIMNTIRENPVPVTMIGVGVAWLLMSGWTTPSESRQYSRSSRPRSYGTTRYGSSGYGSRSMASTGGYAGGTPVPEHTLGERAFTERRLGGERRTTGGAGLSAGTLVGAGGQAERRHGERRTRQGMGHGMGTGQGTGMGQRVGETLGEAKHTMGEAVDTMKQKASETAGQVRQRVGQTLGQAREKATELTEEAREQAQWAEQKVREQVRYVIEEQPLVLGALGIAIGAAIGASLPGTRQEDRLMGEARDELLHRADETGGEMIREVREQVKSGMESMTSGHRETERAESSPVTAGTSSGAIQAEQQRQHGTSSGTGAAAGAGTSGTTAGSTGARTGMSERTPATPQGGTTPQGGGGESRRP